MCCVLFNVVVLNVVLNVVLCCDVLCCVSRITAQKFPERPFLGKRDRSVGDDGKEVLGKCVIVVGGGVVVGRCRCCLFVCFFVFVVRVVCF